MSGDWADLGNRLYEQQGRQGEAEQAYRHGATAGEIQQWPLTAAATALLLALPPSSVPKGEPVPQPTDRELRQVHPLRLEPHRQPAGAQPPHTELRAHLLRRFGTGHAYCLASQELIVRGAYRIQMGSGFWKPSKVVLLPQQPPPLPGSLAQLDALLRPHTPGYIGAVVKKAWAVDFLSRPRNRVGIKKLALEFGGLPSELTERGLAELPTAKELRPQRRTASGDAWAQSAEQHVQRLQGLPQEAENDPQTAARAAAAAGALALLVPASLASLARLRGRSRRRGGDLDLDFAYVSDGVAFDPFDPVGDLYDAALEGGWPTKAPVTVGDLLGLRREGEELDAVSIALDSIRHVVFASPSGGNSGGSCGCG